jgi:hypothetical protein
VGYIARYTLRSSCQYDGYLQSTDGTYNNTGFITDTGPSSAAKILNNLSVNNYYIAMTTGWGCSWSVTFSPLLEVANSGNAVCEWFCIAADGPAVPRNLFEPATS